MSPGYRGRGRSRSRSPLKKPPGDHLGMYRYRDTVGLCMHFSRNCVDV